jgi:SWIM zinc finger
MREVTYAYERASRLVTDPDIGPTVDLATLAPSVGGTPAFFDGWVSRPRQTAALLLVVAAVARSRYFRPTSARLLDPILTSGDDRLRLESFSSCCGVYARADLLPQDLREVSVGTGTTNVDLNPAIRDALARVDDSTEVHLSVGAGGLRVRTRADTAFERKVKLPTRWQKGLGEAALAQVGMRPCIQVGAAAARHALAGLPPAGAASAPPYSVVARGRELQFSQRVLGEAPCVAGPYRLRELRRLAEFATGLGVWARPGAGLRPSAWELELPGARVWLVLSAEVSRGFSGEGEALGVLVDPVAVGQAAALREQLGWRARLDEDELAAKAGGDAARIGDLLAVLGSQGLVGRDLAEDAWFRRDLPFAAALVPKLQPRVRTAAAIGASDLTVRALAGGAEEVFVRSGDIDHRVVLRGADARCTCAWYIRHGGSRGPCRHILAARRQAGME